MAEVPSPVGPGILWCPGSDRKPQGDGYQLDQETGLWVHNGCGLPTKMVYDQHIERGDWDILGLIG